MVMQVLVIGVSMFCVAESGSRVCNALAYSCVELVYSALVWTKVVFVFIREQQPSNSCLCYFVHVLAQRAHRDVAPGRLAHL